MSEQQAADDAARIEEIRGKHDGCLASGDDLCDIPYLLDRLDALRAEMEASRAGEAALVEALGHAVEAVQFLLDEDWPQACDPGPGIRTDLTRWQALLAGRAVPEDA